MPAGGDLRHHQGAGIFWNFQETHMTTRMSLHAPRRKKRKAPGREARPSTAPARSNSAVTPTAPFIEPDRRDAMIADAAYFLAEQRDFCPGHELDDWLTAEREIDGVLSSRQPIAGCAA
jgi:hypothetical protein